MKYIQRKKKKVSLKLKLFIAGMVVAGLLAFLWSCMLTRLKTDYPGLVFSAALKAPECPQNGGFYANEFAVVLKTTVPGARIYYSLDGSEPSMASNLYVHPIVITSRTGMRNNLSLIPTSPRWYPPVGDVFKGTLLRAVVVNDQDQKSEELTRTFFIDSKANGRYSLPVIELTINEKDLFGYKQGIYVLGKSFGDKSNYIQKNIKMDLPWWEYPSNYLDRGDNSERRVHIEFYEPCGNCGFEANAGLRINGNATRGFAQKSLRICFRKKYGQASLTYPLFMPDSMMELSSFILRNSGNDWDKTMFRDAFMQSLMENTNLDIQRYRPSVVFINGEYWGIHNIRERFDEHYLANKYHLSTDSLTILELGGLISYGHKGEAKSFADLLDYVKKNDLAIDSSYKHVCDRMSIPSFTDFLIANIYYCNSDWPNNNVKFWHYKGFDPSDASVHDGRWRWMLYDTDWGFGYNTQSTPSSNLLEKAKRTGSTGVLFSALLRNKKFREQFIARFKYLLNTRFYAPAVVTRINRMQQVLAPEMQEHIDRWRVIGSYRQWLDNVDVLRDFAEKRPKIQARQLNDFFKLGGDNRVFIKE